MMRLSLLLVCLIILVACDRTEEVQYISASACATKVNGEIVECEVDEETLKDSYRYFKFSQQLDTEFPWPEYFTEGETHRVVAVTPGSTLILENGEELAFAGLNCESKKFLPYLNAVFIENEMYKVSYLPTGYEEGSMIFAYVWEMPIAQEPESEPQELSRSIPNWTNLNETGAGNRWCSLIEQKFHSHHERFQKLVNYHEQ